MIGVEIAADSWVHARGSAAGRLDFLALATEAIHVGGRSAQIGYDTGEARHGIADRLDLTDDRVLRAALNDAALVLRDRTKCAATKTPTLDRDREPDHLVRW